MKVLVTGAKGFVGRNLCAALANIRDSKDRRPKYQALLPIEVYEYDLSSTPEELDDWCSKADFVFNLAGVNRPKEQSEFMEGNFGFASTLLDTLERCGESKLAGERLFREYSCRTGAPVLIYRFPNVFGKWCRPNYNSAVATFCHNVANGLPITVNDPSTELELLYIDDLVSSMLDALLGEQVTVDTPEGPLCAAGPTHRATLGEIVSMLESFRDSWQTLEVPDTTPGTLSSKLWSAYESYVPPERASYPLSPRSDERGSFAEFLRTPDRGQVSVNVSAPLAVKGNHWHMSKWERFLVVSGEGLIRMRKVGLDQEGNPYPVFEYRVSGESPEVVEMLPGYTHSIANLSDSRDLVTLMWASEPFDPERSDTYFEEV